MGGQKEKYVEFRYYDMPIGRYDLALLGEVWVCEYGRDALHFHNYLEIGYCYYGDGHIHYGDEKKAYTKGTISIIPNNFIHRTQGPPGVIQKWEYLFVDVLGLLDKFYAGNHPFREHFLNDFLRAPYLVTEKEFPRLSAVVRAILDENREKKPFYEEAVNGYLLVLMQEISRLSSSNMEGNRYEAQVTNIRGALEYIEKHYAEDIKIEDLARECHLSESYFRKVFFQCMNVRPLEYVNLIRIRKVCDLMMRANESLQTLAWKVGFTSMSTFIRNFKQIVGVSPKQWMLKSEKEREHVDYHTNVLKGWQTWGDWDE